VHHELANRIVNRQAVGHVAAGAVDVQGDGFVAFARQLAHALDGRACAVLVDVTDEVDVA
jgi:hypothetical protein